MGNLDIHISKYMPAAFFMLVKEKPYVNHELQKGKCLFKVTIH